MEAQWIHQQEKAGDGETGKPSRAFGELLKAICAARESGAGEDPRTGSNVQLFKIFKLFEACC
jgi:hypothetical protein